MKLLLADDEPVIRSLLRSLLTPLQPSLEVVGEASDGAEALALYQRTKPDVIFTDIRMPQMDGLDFLVEIRKTDPDIPVVLISAYNEFGYAQKALKNGAFDYLLKPIEEEELYRVLENLRQHLQSVRRQKKQITKMELELRKLKDELTGDNPLAQQADHRQMDGKAAIARVLHYLHNHYAEDLTLAYVARQAYLYPTYFSELFKRETGKGFNEYLNQLRVEKAKALLGIKSLKLSEVSEMVGYRDQGYFTKQFRRYAGLSPNAYRTGTQYQKEEPPHEADRP